MKTIFRSAHALSTSPSQTHCANAQDVITRQTSPFIYLVFGRWLSYVRICEKKCFAGDTLWNLSQVIAFNCHQRRGTWILSLRIVAGNYSGHNMNFYRRISQQIKPRFAIPVNFLPDLCNASWVFFLGLLVELLSMEKFFKL